MKDRQINDLNVQITTLQLGIEASEKEGVSARRETEQGRRELEAEQARHRDTKEMLKQCEEKCTQLYQELINQNRHGADRWTEIQKKYEETQSLLAK